MINNKRITATESLQNRLLNGSKNHAMKIEKLMQYHSSAKKRIYFG